MVTPVYCDDEVDVSIQDLPRTLLATEPDRRLAAIMDFTFNLGAGRLQASTLRRRINQQDWTAAGVELRRWVHGGGKILPGLVARRESEVALLMV